MTGSRRPGGMSTILQRFGLIGAAVALPAIFWLLTPPPQPSRGAPAGAGHPLSPTPSIPSVAHSPYAAPESLPHGETYAVALPALRGLAADTPPGTELKLWAAWDPPVTKQPRIQILINRVVLKAIVPPADPNAPPTALLLVPADSIPDLLYGDRYGALSVTIPEGP
ncbi:MAG: hypothetical protein ABR505_08120 [Actinomycetota bacterium]